MRLFSKSKPSGWLAVTVGEHDICAAHVVRAAGSRPAVMRAMITNGGGSAIASALDRLSRDWQVHGLQCTTLLEPAQYQFLPVEAPNVPPSELRSAISWILRDMVDFPIEDATVDVIEIPTEKGAPTGNRTMYAVVANSKIIEERQTLLGDARIPLSVIDIPEMAQRNIAALVEPSGRGLGLFSSGSTGSLLTISHAGELYLARRIDVALNELIQPDATAAHERVTLEVQRSLDHFGRQFHQINVAKVLLAPLGDESGALKEHLSANLELPVESLKLDTILETTEAPELRSPVAQQQMFMTLGAALRA